LEAWCNALPTVTENKDRETFSNDYWSEEDIQSRNAELKRKLMSADKENTNLPIIQFK
jgi:hypothetical protein